MIALMPLESARAQDGGLQATGTTLIPVAGQPFPPLAWEALPGAQAWGSLTAFPDLAGAPIVARFTGLDPDAADYSVSISWGDGSPSSAGSAQSDGDGGFWALGAYAYAASGAYSIAVAIADTDGGDAIAQSNAFVLPDLLTVTPEAVSTVEGAEQSLTVATAEGPSPRATSYLASIDWGDGTSSPGRVSPGIAPGFDVVGFHAYATAGSFTIGVAVSFYEEGSMVPDRLTVTSAATVSDAPLAGSDGGPFLAFQGVPYSGVVATFSDANPFGTWADYAATIDWGDGDGGLSTADRIAPLDGGFAVFGTHVYDQEGTFVAGVAIIDGAGSSTFASATATVVPVPDGGPVQDAGMEDAGLIWVSDDGGPLSFGDGGTAAGGCGCRGERGSAAGPGILLLVTLVLARTSRRRRVAEAR